jgi:uncharacterized protein
MTAREIIAALGMEPHPEGGWYVETFKDVAGPDGRARSTAIYFLLEAGQVSHWHRVDAVEVWHWHAGSPLELRVADEMMVLGPDILAGQRPQGIVPEGAWQTARSLGDWTLVGCTVAPGFRFEGFELAAEGWVPG